MVACTKPVSLTEKSVPARFVESTLMPEPSTKPLIPLYSKPYENSWLQPEPVVDPFTVALLAETAVASPVRSVATVLFPEPLTGTEKPATPPPVTGILPSKTPIAGGVNLT